MKSIILPNDSQLRTQLETKLQEYRQRNESSELIPVLRQRAVFKEEALRLLLQDGVLDVASFFAQCEERFGDRLETHDFYEALGVIHSYCTGVADHHVKGGSGLPPPNQVGTPRI